METLVLHNLLLLIHHLFIIQSDLKVKFKEILILKLYVYMYMYMLYLFYFNN